MIDSGSQFDQPGRRSPNRKRSGRRGLAHSRGTVIGLLCSQDSS